MAQNSNSLLLSGYLFASALVPFLGRLIANRRMKIGKEDPNRIAERFGVPSISRPQGKIIWFHAASVGEALSVLPLVRLLKQKRPDTSILLTTGTLTSAKIVKMYAGKEVLHQFIPYDIKPWIGKFLSYWKPSLTVLVESELWPTIIVEVKKAKIPLILINGRMSEKSLYQWQKHPKTASVLMNKLDHVTVQTQDVKSLFHKIGYPKEKIEVVESLKLTADPLPHCPNDLDDFKSTIDGKIVWVAASTHQGEEEAILKVFKLLSQKIQNLFLIIVPRHPERGKEIKAMAGKIGIDTKLRTENTLPSPDDKVYIADTLGEMGLWYRIGNFAFIGGSLVSVGGHNPYEPAILECPIIHGPHVFNFSDAYQKLSDCKGSIPITSPNDLERVVKKIVDTTVQKKLTENAKRILQMNQETINYVADLITSIIIEQNK